MKRLCVLLASGLMAFVLVLGILPQKTNAIICMEEVQCNIWSCTGTSACINSGGAQTVFPCADPTKNWYEYDSSVDCGALLAWWNVFWDCAFPAGECGGSQSRLNPACI